MISNAPAPHDNPTLLQPATASLPVLLAASAGPLATSAGSGRAAQAQAGVPEFDLAARDGLVVTLTVRSGCGRSI